jgi:hypothetical protein
LNCDERNSPCRANEVLVAGGDCEVCHFESTPNPLQTECVVGACDAFPKRGICSCQLTNLTKEESGSVNVACNGTRWPEEGQLAVELPGYVSRLTLTSVPPAKLSGLLQELSDRRNPTGSVGERVPPATGPSSSHTTSSDETTPAFGETSSAQSTILAVMVNKAAFDVLPTGDPSTVSSASKSQSATSNTSNAVASQNIALLPMCGMGDVVPALDFGIPIGVCGSSSDGPEACNGGTLCPPGQFADMSNSANRGECTLCERGGFYADTAGRVGEGSHCACSACKNGTWSASAGAINQNKHCQVCPPGTQTDAAAGYRACACLPNFSRTDRFGECSSCEGGFGIECAGDARVLQKGYYWQFPSNASEQEFLQFTVDLRRSNTYNRGLPKFNGTYPQVKKCPTPANCLGVTENSAASCLEGTKGPLCAVCDATHYRMNGACSACPTNKAASAVLLVIIAIVIVLAIWAALRCNAKDVPAVDEWNKGRHDAKTSAANPETSIANKNIVSLMSLAKIVLSYTQIQALLVEVYPGVQWPTSYRKYSDAQQFVSSNPISIMMPSCLSSLLTISSYTEFKFAALAPIVVAPVIAIYYLVKARCGANLAQLQAVCISTGSFIYFLLYPAIAVSSVRVLAKCDEICRTDDDDDCIPYLRADYSIRCDTDEHVNYKVAAGFAFVVYSVLFPAIIAVLLYRGRQGAATTTESALMAGFSFYSKNYKPEYYYWEAVDLYRKLLVTSMVVFIADGTSLQITFGIIFAFVGFALQLVHSPFVHRNENRLAVASQAITVLALIIGGLIRASSAEKAALMEYGSISEFVTASYLITSGVLLYCIGLIMWIMYKYAGQEKGNGNVNSKVTQDHSLVAKELTEISELESANTVNSPVTDESICVNIPFAGHIALEETSFNNTSRKVPTLTEGEGRCSRCNAKSQFCTCEMRRNTRDMSKGHVAKRCPQITSAGPCTNVVGTKGGRCDSHTCQHPGCSRGKSSKVEYCDDHSKKKRTVNDGDYLKVGGTEEHESGV